jgi:hypothetical protein
MDAAARIDLMRLGISDSGSSDAWMRAPCDLPGAAESGTRCSNSTTDVLDRRGDAWMGAPAISGIGCSYAAASGPLKIGVDALGTPDVVCTAVST